MDSIKFLKPKSLIWSRQQFKMDATKRLEKDLVWTFVNGKSNIVQEELFVFMEFFYLNPSILKWPLWTIEFSPTALSSHDLCIWTVIDLHEILPWKLQYHCDMMRACCFHGISSRILKDPNQMLDLWQFFLVIMSRMVGRISGEKCRSIYRYIYFLLPK